VPDGGFAAFWDELDQELARYPAAPELELLPLRSTELATAYGVRLTSLGPYRIFGYYSVPRGPGPFPGLLLTPRYGSVNHVPDYYDRERYAVLQVVHRGQRLADQPFAAAYPGLLTLGIDSPATYIYRGIAADCLRGAEFLLSRPEVDPLRVGLEGDDLALLTAARRPQFTALLATGLLFYRLLEASQRTDVYPVQEVADYLRAFPERQAAVVRTLAYWDPLHHAPGVRARCLIPRGDAAALDGSAWLAPLLQALGGPVAELHLSHEGGTDHDRLDAWMATQLGTAPRSRFLQQDA